VGSGPETEFYLCYLEYVPPPKPIVVGVVDNRQAQPGTQTINNVEVVGNFGHLGAFLEAHTIDLVIYFPAVLTPSQVQEAREICDRYSAPARAFPDLLKLTARRTTERQEAE